MVDTEDVISVMEGCWQDVAGIFRPNEQLESMLSGEPGR